MSKTEFDEATLQRLSIAELEQLSARVTALIAGKMVAEKAAVRDDIEGLLEERGLRLDQVFEELAPKRRGRRPLSEAEAAHAAAGKPNGHGEV